MLMSMPAPLSFCVQLIAACRSGILASRRCEDAEYPVFYARNLIVREVASFYGTATTENLQSAIQGLARCRGRRRLAALHREDEEDGAPLPLALPAHSRHRRPRGRHRAGVLFGSSKAHKEIRRVLVDENKLTAVISMPSGVFKPYAGVSTAILLFTKIGREGSGTTDKVWFYDMHADGYTLDDKRQPTDASDIPDILERFHHLENETSRKRTEQSFFVPVEDNRKNGYDLSLNKYKEIEYVPVEYPSTEELLGKIDAADKEYAESMEKLREMLG